ncbi:hypothetical protein CsSME_00031077 [Camellia sinensis var. sinensis]
MRQCSHMVTCQLSYRLATWCYHNFICHIVTCQLSYRLATLCCHLIIFVFLPAILLIDVFFLFTTIALNGAANFAIMLQDIDVCNMVFAHKDGVELTLAL